MTIKEYEERLKVLESTIRSKQSRLKYLRKTSEDISAPNLTGMPRNPSAPVSGETRILDKIIDLAREIAGVESQVMRLKADLLDAIDKVENEEFKMLLTIRYIGRKTWKDVAEEMSYSVRWVYAQTPAAIHEVEKFL